MSGLRPLPSRPRVEFVRKEAKSLLRMMRAGDREALTRASACHPPLARRAPESLKLADAQLVVAREYGFASWPRLVRYFDRAERVLDRTPSRMSAGRWSAEEYEGEVARVVQRQAKGDLHTARLVVSFVPRFDGMSADAIRGEPIADAEARLVIARSRGFASWEAFISRVRFSHESRSTAWAPNALQLAGRAIHEGNLPALQRVVDEHPELRTPDEDALATGAHLVATAVGAEWER